jgi:hypothetical protein
MLRLVVGGLTVAVAAGVMPAGPASALTSPDPDRPQVTIATTSWFGLLGERIKITGATRAPAPGARVRLEVHYREKGRRGWKVLATKRLDAQSSYTFTDELGSLRRRKYRVVRVADGLHPAARSFPLEVDVFVWQPMLTDLGNFVHEDATMAGRLYPDSYTTTMGQKNPFGGIPRPGADHSARCIELDTTVGLDDSSPAGSTAVVYGPAGTPTTYTVGAPVHLDVKIETALDVGSSSFAFVDEVDPGEKVVFGTPTVLCNYVIAEQGRSTT